MYHKDSNKPPNFGPSVEGGLNGEEGLLERGAYLKFFDKDNNY